MNETPNSQVLATDLDGTLIPLPGHQENRVALQVIRQAMEEGRLHITFVTGRHLASVEQAIKEEGLPVPDWIICDVGASIYRRTDNGFEKSADYDAHLKERSGVWSRDQLASALNELSEIRLQEPEKQGQFKLSYYAPADHLDHCVEQARHILQDHQIPWSIISSVDPFNGDGLIDFLPKSINKAYAVQWWAESQSLPTQALIFAGDSGNDIAALEHGYRAIVVGNAERDVAARAWNTHHNHGTPERIFLARESATSGVLEGLRWFEALPLAPTTDSVSLGAVPLTCHTSRVSVWAPRSKSMSVRYRATKDSKWQQSQMEFERKSGIHQALIPVGARSQYQFRLDEQRDRPDPRSGYLPTTVHAASEIVDHSYPWRDSDWRGIDKRDLVIYELHVGTFTEEGTYLAAIRELDELIALGVTAIEIMPVAECPGRWNWGYDGVQLFAPNKAYGSPHDLRSLVEACHLKGLAVILDVVYNHLGPEGNYLSEFGPYFTKRHGTPWGSALNFDGPKRAAVRQFMVDNALHWLQQYRFDGLRLDAIHFMFDDSDYPITQEICDAVRSYEQQADRSIHLIGEANIYDHALIQNQDGTSYCAIWADCLMHSIYSHGVPEISLSHREYVGADDIVETLRHGYLYTGPKLARQSRSPSQASTTTATQLSSLIMALQTHDGVGNHPHGKRIHQLTNVRFQAAAAPLFLLYPAIPMMFMGEEFAAASPFRFFADFLDPGLRAAVDRGRQQEYPNHQWEGALPPSSPDAFHSSKLPTGRTESPMYLWYQQLLTLRKKGVSSGWLSGDRLRVDFDAPLHQFHLTYREGNHSWTIASQLIPPAKESSIDFPRLAPENLPDTATLLLDSDRNFTDLTGSSRCLIYQQNT